VAIVGEQFQHAIEHWRRFAGYVLGYGQLRMGGKRGDPIIGGSGPHSQWATCSYDKAISSMRHGSLLSNARYFSVTSCCERAEIPFLLSSNRFHIASGTAQAYQNNPPGRASGTVTLFISAKLYRLVG
jgi:hypothetical protein